MHHKHLAYICMRILGSTKQDHINMLTFQPAQEYAWSYWEAHWRAFSHTIELDDEDARRGEMNSLISHLRLTHSPYCELAFATYILMNPEPPPPLDVIFPEGSYKMEPGVHDTALVDLLQENVPPTYSVVIIEAVSILRRRRPHYDGDELQAIWGEITPRLPDLSKYYLDVVGMGVKYLFVDQPVERGHIFTCNTAKPPATFLWCLTSLPQHLALAIQHEPSGLYSWPLAHQEFYDCRATWQTFFPEIFYEEKEYKESLIRNVGLAVRAAAKLKGSEISLDDERHLWQWNWEMSFFSPLKMLLQSRRRETKNIELSDLVNAYKTLAECLQETCGHEECPVGALSQSPS
ncbi:hypothetical protein DFP72DRAFT_904578 [Ephemerocybe angulata]|uniref:Uncharacterized protein n=1 Tax=Ephemerocybe angulata TaxID=980116 RepID=A0A8H6M4D6_9AGAR|nr:hypothetical protein DFP72DRAFT_904578 [Tulosesus angulatus]